MTPMECKEIFASLSEYLDGELPADLCEEIAAHIGECPPCVEFVESLKKTMALAKSTKPSGPAPEIPEAAVERLRQLYRQRRGP